MEKVEINAGFVRNLLITYIWKETTGMKIIRKWILVKYVARESEIN